MIRNTVTEFANLTNLPVIQPGINPLEFWSNPTPCVYLGTYTDHLGVLLQKEVHPLMYTTVLIRERDRNDLISFVTYIHPTLSHHQAFVRLFTPHGVLVSASVN